MSIVRERLLGLERIKKKDESQPPRTILPGRTPGKISPWNVLSVTDPYVSEGINREKHHQVAFTNSAGNRPPPVAEGCRVPPPAPPDAGGGSGRGGWSGSERSGEGGGKEASADDLDDVDAPGEGDRQIPVG